MEASIFIFYLIITGYFLTRLPFVKRSGLNPIELIALFLIKVFAGIAYAFFYTLPTYAADADTWRFYKESVTETKWLYTNPGLFLADLFSSGYGVPSNIFAGQNSYWNDLKSNVIIKLMAVLNVITNHSYYAQIILFNFLFIMGQVALYKLFIGIYPGKKWLIIAGLFLLPSTLFWCSGIHKDGLILSGIGIISYLLSRSFKKEWKWNTSIVMLLALLFIFVLRNYVALAIIIAGIWWAIANKFPNKKGILFLLIVVMGVTFFFLGSSIHPSLNFPAYLSGKQQEFLKLGGNSAIAVQVLRPSLPGYLQYFPTAVTTSFFRPGITEISNIGYWPAMVELYFVYLICVPILFKLKHFRGSDAVRFLVFLSIIILLISGYTITFVGAIVRYRSLILPFIVVPLLCNIPFKSFKLNKE